MGKPRRIFFLTGARSEYDITYPVAREAAGREGLRSELLVCAAHLSPFHGQVIEQIHKDGLPVAACLETLLSSESPQGRALSFSNLISALTQFMARDRPDLIFVTGDREEALAGALVGVFLGIHVAHLHGGDRCLASDIDEVLRPAISKLANIHFTATEGHRQRLIRMGEAPDWVFTTGAPGLDRLITEPDLGDEALAREFSFDPSRPFFMIIHHPCPTLAPQDSGREMELLLEGVLSLGHPVFCSYPNSDPGNVAIRQTIDTLRLTHRQLVVYHHLPRDLFVSLYRRCSAMVGNSSSLVIESGFLKVPGILVGRRQELREAGPNVLRVPAQAEAVRAACLRTLNDQEFIKAVRQTPSIYGDGKSASRIAQLLDSLELSPEPLLKTIPY